MRIAPTKDQAIDEESGDSAPVRIFSDGSGIEGNIGSAAVLYRRKNGVETKHVLRYYLNPKTRHTVYKAEVAGEIMAQELVRDIHSVTLHTLSPTKLGLCLSFFGFISFINSYLYEFITHYV